MDISKTCNRILQNGEVYGIQSIAPCFFNVKKCFLGSPEDPSETFLWVCKVKSIFIIAVRHYLPFLFSFFHEDTAEFSRGYVTCDIAAD